MIRRCSTPKRTPCGAISRTLPRAQGVGLGALFVRLSRLGLDGAALEVVALCLAPDLDARYGRVYGFIHDDVTRRRASRAILRHVLETGQTRGATVHAALSVGAPLRALGILLAQDGEPASAQASLHCDPVILCALHGDSPGDLAAVIRRRPWPRYGPAAPDTGAVGQALARSSGRPHLLQVASEQRAERRDWAEALLDALNAAPLRIELESSAVRDEPASAALGRPSP